MDNGAGRNRGACTQALATLALALLAGCGAGITSVVATSGSSGGGNSAPSIVNLQVPVSRSSPARIRFELADREGESVRVELCARMPLVGGGLGDPQLLTHVGGPDFPANGASVTIPAGNQAKVVDVDWRFPDESFLPDDGRFVEGVQLLARLASGAELVLGDDEPLSLGNDAPEVSAVTPVIAAAEGEAVGILRIEVSVTDSSDDVVTVMPEYDVQGDTPDAGWQPATGFGLENVQVARTGSTLDFFWETDTDLHDLEREVVLRFTPTDFALTGPSLASERFRVDNNEEPIVQIDSGPLILNPDERRGIPIPFRVIDEENDLVEVIFQWRREGEEFPGLPGDMAALDAILADPLLRQEKHVCTPYPHYATGHVVPIDTNTVRLPELASSEAWILASGIEGRTLELLPPSSALTPLTPTWISNPLDGALAVLPIGDSTTAVVVDAPGGTTRVREIEVLTGAVERELATLAPGAPTAATCEFGELAVLVALDLGAAWRLDRVELASGTVTELYVSDAGAEPPPVRGLASLGSKIALLTAGSSLLQLDYREPSAAVLSVLRDDLVTPWGVVVDPRKRNRVYVAERDAPRPDGTGVLSLVELDTHQKTNVLVKEELLGPLLLEPESLALDSRGTRLLAVVTAVFRQPREVRAGPAGMEGAGFFRQLVG